MSITVPRKFSSLKKKGEIRSVMRNGRKVYTAFGIFFILKEENSTSQMAVLIKKSIGNAVQRNYRKRIVREYLRSHLHYFSIGYRIVFLFNFAGPVQYHLVEQEFDRKLKLSAYSE